MNKPLIMDTLKLIEENPGRWDQDAFSDKTDCGTTMCFGGWALALSGYTLDEQAHFHTPHGHRMSWLRVEDTAQDLLGLSDDQVESIFYFFPDSELDKAEQFKQFKDHVLAVTGIADES